MEAVTCIRCRRSIHVGHQCDNGSAPHCPHCGQADCTCIVCFCDNPVVSPLGECQRCHRKPERFLGVFGRDALLAAGAVVADV